MQSGRQASKRIAVLILHAEAWGTVFFTYRPTICAHADSWLSVSGCARRFLEPRYSKDLDRLLKAQKCGTVWEADHIVPLHRAGDSFDPSNLQILCIPCHRDKTRQEMKERAARKCVLPPCCALPSKLPLHDHAYTLFFEGVGPAATQNMLCASRESDK